MADQPNPSTPGDVVILTEEPENEPDKGREPPPVSMANLGGRTYTVTGLVQAQAPQKSLGSYVKAG
jgi:hypothetical protein